MIEIKTRRRLGRLAPHKPVYLQTAPLPPLKISKLKIYRINITTPKMHKMTFGIVVSIKMLPQKYFEFAEPEVLERLPRAVNYKIHRYNMPFEFEGEVRWIDFVCSMPGVLDTRSYLLQASKAILLDLGIDDPGRPRSVDFHEDYKPQWQNLDFHLPDNFRSSNFDFIIPPISKFEKPSLNAEANNVHVSGKHAPNFRKIRRPQKINLAIRFRRKPKTAKFSFPSKIASIDALKLLEKGMKVKVVDAMAALQQPVKVRKDFKKTAFAKITPKAQKFRMKSGVVGQSVEAIPKVKINSMGTNALIVYAKKSEEVDPEATVVDE